MTNGEVGSNISFSTKELLSDIKAQLSLIQAALITKADQVSLSTLQRQVEAQERRVQIMESSGAGPDHEKRIRELERSDAIYNAQSQDRRYLYGALATLITVMVGLATFLVFFAKR